jgi:hypothetical protein
MTDKPSYMSDADFRSYERGDILRIGEYTIKPKRDFGSTGFLIDGEYNIKVGWIVVKDGALATPGGVWAKTIAGAKRHVGALMASKGDPDVFHGLMMLTRKEPEA